MTKPETPILALKDTKAPSVFQPANLLREARRQRGLDHADVPELCLLDPDGDIVRYLERVGEAEQINQWACYYTEMWRFQRDGLEFGVVGCAVGAPFAVLVAEQMFASGCRFLISITSSGQITPVGEAPYYILIDRALRDEGASYHYLPPSRGTQRKRQKNGAQKGRGLSAHFLHDRQTQIHQPSCSRLRTG